MTTQTTISPGHLSSVVHRAQQLFCQRISGAGHATPWWDAVIITASSAQQAAQYDDEIRRRREQGKLPSGVYYLVVADPEGKRVGNGGATIHALRRMRQSLPADEQRLPLNAWWRTRRVLMVHSGGDSRRLPQYSLSGKLFSRLPVKTPWGEVSTVFDEIIALSSSWASQLAAGLVVISGDVILTFESDMLHWERPGIAGVAMPCPVQTAIKHGVYIAGEDGAVYSFLQKPTHSQIRAAGGLLDEDVAAVDTGLLRFDAQTAAQLGELAESAAREGDWTETTDGATLLSDHFPQIDLYEHLTRLLTDQWSPAADAHPLLHRLSDAFHGTPFWCDLVEGCFTHVGTTKLFRDLMTEDTEFARLYQTQQRLGVTTPPGMRSSGVIIDSVFHQGGEMGVSSIAIECDLEAPVQAGAGAILHGLTHLSKPVVVPEDTVAHQVPVALPDGRKGTVIRVYGVGDDTKISASAESATWLNRPVAETLALLGLDADDVWEGVEPEARSLWNARLFPVDTPDNAWAAACWMLGIGSDYDAARWRQHERLSLETSTRYADNQALADARVRRTHSQWQATAFTLAISDADVRPLLAYAPGIGPLAETGRMLSTHAHNLEATAPTEAASRHYQAHQCFAHAGLSDDAHRSFGDAFDCVRRAVDAGVYEDIFADAGREWRHQRVHVTAPARIDLGGGWSDTPPFCLDWGGTVFNLAIALDGAYPISTTITRIPDPVIRCLSADGGKAVTYRTTEELLAAPSPGDPFAVPRAAMQLMRLASEGDDLAAILRSCGGGVEIRTQVALPMGSGLGTSSILAATVLQGLAAMRGIDPTPYQFSDQVMRLEQVMTTGGGWQDQAGSIFPGVKLLATGPGARQRIRVQPVACPPEQLATFSERCVLYYTGFQRVAKNLLSQVVGRYLAREVATVQVLHSLKTLAAEMAYAFSHGEWAYLGELLDRHWQLNQVLDEHTTNAPINQLLAEVRPHLAGAKLAGAGGGGFLIMLARSAEDARALRAELAARPGSGVVYTWEIAQEGLHIAVDA